MVMMETEMVGATSSFSVQLITVRGRTHHGQTHRLALTVVMVAMGKEKIKARMATIDNNEATSEADNETTIVASIVVVAVEVLSTPTPTTTAKAAIPEDHGSNQTWPCQLHLHR
jgi:hypothetical protein